MKRARSLGLLGCTWLLATLAGACGGNVDKNPSEPSAGGTQTMNGTAGKGSKPGVAGSSAGVGGSNGSGGATPVEACTSVRDEAPGEVIYNEMGVGAGECANTSLSEVLAAIHELRPDLADIVSVSNPEQPQSNGSRIHAFQRPDGGFAIVMQRGEGDCPAGCIINDYWYFETGPDCVIEEVGEAHRDFEHCMEPDQLPRWGIPYAAMPSEICDADLSAQDLSGRYSVVTCGTAVASCLDSKDKGEPQPLPASLLLSIQQDPQDLTRGTVTFQGTGDPLLDGQPFEAMFERKKVTVLANSSDLPWACQESWSLDFSYDFEGLAAARLNFESVRTPNCANEPNNYCKGQVSATFGEATRQGDVCVYVDCEGLDEEACSARAASDDYDGCMPRYGNPWPGDASDEPVYAGCAPVCCLSNDCPGSPAAEMCAASPEGKCWTLSSPPAPAGWQLFEADSCQAVLACAP